MNSTFVRITCIELENFRNVGYGKIDIVNSHMREGPNILGVYGPNGTGKTTLIAALAVLKYALSGKQLPADYVDCININADYARLKFSFMIKDKVSATSYDVRYEFKLSRIHDEELLGKEPFPLEESIDIQPLKASVESEVLSCSIIHPELKMRMARIVDTRNNDLFLPEGKFKELVGTGPKVASDLIVAKKLAYLTSRSFVFSRALLEQIRKVCENDIYKTLFNALSCYGTYELFVIQVRSTSLISMNALPLYFGSSEIKNAKIENVTLQLDKPSLIPEAVLPFVEKTVVNINIVLSTIIPSLNIRIRYLNKEVMRNGTIGINISLLSEKDGREMPLKYESEGIKKIISILHFFITAYNLPFVTLAIDELDSGIFEYLLGELLRIFSNGGKGQLVFTSHNLRPLETIDRNFIAFTTTNPSNRYMRMRNIKATNNVRDMYYRNLIFNEQVTKDTDFETRLYDKIENYEIARALEKAGDLT